MPENLKPFGEVQLRQDLANKFCDTKVFLSSNNLKGEFSARKLKTIWWSAVETRFSEQILRH